MTILTKDMKTTIVSRAIAHKLGKKIETADAEERALAEEAYNHLFKEKVRDALAVLPAEFKDLGKGMHVNVGGAKIYLKFSWRMPVPFNNRYAQTVGVIYGELGNRILNNAALKEDIERERKELDAQLHGFLMSFRSAKILAERWPEGVQFFQDFLDADRRGQTLPAPATVEINRALGLVKGGA